MKNKFLGIAILLLAIVFVAGCASSGNQGTLVMKITDAPAGLNIEKAEVTISKIQVHLAGQNETEGAETESNWFTVVNGPVTYDLIEIKDVTEVLGQKVLDAGRYTQVRLTVDKALVTIDGIEQNLEIPSKTIKLVKGFTIEANKTTSITLDFDAQESIIQAGDKYQMKPTIKIVEG